MAARRECRVRNLVAVVMETKKLTSENSDRDEDRDVIMKPFVQTVSVDHRIIDGKMILGRWRLIKKLGKRNTICA